MSISKQSDVAIVVPWYKTDLGRDEELSMRQLQSCLEGYDKYLILPQTLEFDQAGFSQIRYEDAYFRNIASYSRLLLSEHFYRVFERYSHILVYQLDALVLDQTLEDWTSKDLDYIGAPFFTSKMAPQLGMSRVGNGGLSLRNVASALRVLTSQQRPNLKVVWSRLMPDIPKTNIKKRLRVIRAARRGAQWYSKNYTLNEDLFWSDRARLFDPLFSIAPIETGLQFAFDAHPRYCFENNGRQLPFGAHAWSKWDRSFWEPYL